MTEELLNCDKHRTVDQDLKIISINESEDSEESAFESIGACRNPPTSEASTFESKGACHNPPTTLTDIPDVAQSITAAPTPSLQLEPAAGMLG